MAIKLKKTHSNSDSFYKLDDRVLSEGAMGGEKVRSGSADLFSKMTRFNKNILKSARNVAYDIDGAYVPNAKEFRESMKDVARQAMDDIGGTLDGIKSFVKGNSDKSLGDRLTDGIAEQKKDIVSRLKSGKIYMTGEERMTEQAMASFGADFGGDDFSFGGDDFSFGDDFGGKSDTYVTEAGEDTLPDEPFSAPVHKGTPKRVNVSAKQRAMKRKSTVKRGGSSSKRKSASGGGGTRVGELRLGDELVSQTTSKVGQSILAQNQEIWAKNFAADEVRTNKLVTVQTNILKGVNAIVDFNNNVLSANTRAQLEFQEKMIAAQEDTLSSLKELKDALIVTTTYKGYGTTEDTEPIDSYGGINSNNYYKRIKENLGNMLGETSIGSLFYMAPMLADSVKTAGEMGMSLTPDIMGSLVRGVISSRLLSGKTRSKLNMANAMLANAGALFTGKMNEMAEYGESGIARVIGRLLGTGGTKVKNINMGLEDPNAVVGWTAKSDRTLNEVIPRYLSKMTAALTGGEETYYDYRSGTFKTAKTLKERYKQDISGAFDNFEIRRYRDKIVSREIDKRTKAGVYNGFTSEEEKQKAIKAEADRLDEALRIMTTNAIRSGMPFDPSLENKPGYKEMITNGVDDELKNIAFDVLKRGYQSMNMAEQNEFNGGIGKTRSNANRIMDAANAEYATYGGGGLIAEFAAENEISENRRILGTVQYYYTDSSGKRVVVGNKGDTGIDETIAKLKQNGVKVYERVVGGDRNLRYDTGNKLNSRYLQVKGSRLGIERQTRELEMSSGIRSATGIVEGTKVAGFGELGDSTGGNVSVPGTVNNIFKLLAMGIPVYTVGRTTPKHIIALRNAFRLADNAYTESVKNNEAAEKEWLDAEAAERRELASDRYNMNFMRGAGMSGFMDLWRYASEDDRLNNNVFDKMFGAGASLRIKMINNVFGTGGISGKGLFTMDGMDEYEQVIRDQRHVALKYVGEQIEKLKQMSSGSGKKAALAKKFLPMLEKKYKIIKKNISSEKGVGGTDFESNKLYNDIADSISMVYRAYGINNYETDSKDMMRDITLGLYKNGKAVTPKSVDAEMDRLLSSRDFVLSSANDGTYSQYDFKHWNRKESDMPVGIGKKAKNDDEREFNRLNLAYKLYYEDASGKKHYVRSYETFVKHRFEIKMLSRFGIDGVISRSEANAKVKETANEALFELGAAMKKFLNKIHATGEVARYSGAIYRICNYIGRGKKTLQSTIRNFRRDIKGSKYLKYVLSDMFTDGSIRLTPNGVSEELDAKDTFDLIKKMIGRLSDAEFKDTRFADQFQEDAIAVKNKVLKSGQSVFGKVGARAYNLYNKFRDPNFDFKREAIETYTSIKHGVKNRAEAILLTGKFSFKNIRDSLISIGLEGTLELYKNEIAEDPALREIITKINNDPRIKNVTKFLSAKSDKFAGMYDTSKEHISDIVKSLQTVGYTRTVELYKDEIAKNPKIKELIEKLHSNKTIRKASKWATSEVFKLRRKTAVDDLFENNDDEFSFIDNEYGEFDDFPEIKALLSEAGVKIPKEAKANTGKFEEFITAFIRQYSVKRHGKNKRLAMELNESYDYKRLVHKATRLRKTNGVDTRSDFAKRLQTDVTRLFRGMRNAKNTIGNALQTGMMIKNRFMKYGIKRIYPKIMSLLYSIGIDASYFGEGGSDTDLYLSDMQVYAAIQMAKSDPKNLDVIAMIEESDDYARLMKNMQSGGKKLSKAEKSRRRKEKIKKAIAVIAHPVKTAKKVGRTVSDFINDLRHAYPQIMKILGEHKLLDFAPERGKNVKEWEKNLVTFIENLNSISDMGDNPSIAQQRIMATPDWERLKHNANSEDTRFQRMKKALKTKLNSSFEKMSDRIRDITGIDFKEAWLDSAMGAKKAKLFGINYGQHDAQYYENQRFARGGLVNGPESGDRVPVRMNGGEMVLTKKHQAGLFSVISGLFGGGSTANDRINTFAFANTRGTDIGSVIKGDTDSRAKKAVKQVGPMAGMLVLLSQMNRTLASTLKVLGGNNKGEIDESNEETIAGQINGIGGSGKKGGIFGPKGLGILGANGFGAAAAGLAALAAVGAAGFGKKIKDTFGRFKNGGVSEGLTYGLGLQKEGDSEFNVDGSKKNVFQRAFSKFGDQSTKLLYSTGVTAEKAAIKAAQSKVFKETMFDLGAKGGKGLFGGLRNTMKAGNSLSDIKAMRQLAGEAAEAAGKGMKFKDAIVKLFGKVLENKVVQRVLGSGPMKAIKKTFGTLAGKITSMISKGVNIGVRSVPFISLIPAIADIVIEISNGVSAAGRYFKVPASQVTAGMRATSALYKGIISLVSNAAVVFVPGAGAIITEIVRACLPEKWLIENIYKAVAGEAGREELAEKQKMMEEDAAELGVDSDMLNEFANKTVGQRFADFFSNVGASITGKKWGAGAAKKYAKKMGFKNEDEFLDFASRYDEIESNRKKNKKKKKKGEEQTFASGGIVLGDRDIFGADRVSTRLNPREMVLNDQQQYGLFQKIKSFERDASMSGGVAHLNESPMLTNIKADLKDIEEAINIQKAIYAEQRRHNDVVEQFFTAMLKLMGGIASNGGKTIREIDDEDLTNLTTGAYKLASGFGRN